MSHDSLIPPKPSAPDETPLRCFPRYQPMVLCVLAVIAGILVDKAFDWDWRYYLATIVISLSVWSTIRLKATAFSSTTRSTARLRQESIASTLLLIGLVGLGSFWHHGRWNWFGEYEIGRYTTADSQPCALDATVISEPRWLAPKELPGGLDYADTTVRTRVTLRANQIRDGQQWQPATGTLDLVIHAATRHVAAGDQVRVFGRLVKSSPPTNPGQFDFQNFYRSKSKLAFLHAYHVDSVQVIKPSSWASARILSRLRRKLNDLTWKHIGSEEAPFAAAILLGNREQLSSGRRELFLETGTVHLLAISGLHVGILAGSFFLLFRLGMLGRERCLLLTIAFVIFYAWLVEFRPPVSRAAILIVLYCVGRLLGETNFSYNLLAIAALIVLIINPADLFGIGPQLSFLAVATLTFGKDWVFWPPPTDPIKRLIASTRPSSVRFVNWLGRQTRTAILVSGLIWFVAMPLVAFRFNLVAPVALLVNPLLLIPIAWALYGGLGVMLFGWFLPPLATLCGKFCELNLSWIEWMIAGAQAVPFSHTWTAGPTFTSLVVFYTGLFFVAVFPLTRLPFRWVATLGLCWLVFGWLIPDQIAEHHRRANPNPLVCTFIDVGHGSGVLLQLPNGKNVLYDAGSFGSADYGFRNVAGTLWHERISHLDAVVISHADIDHFNAIPELSRRFSIGVVFITPQMLASDSPSVTTLLTQLNALKIPVRTIYQGDRLVTRQSQTGSGSESAQRLLKCSTLSILNPPQAGTGGNDNSDSVVMLVEFGDRAVLLPGDLEKEGLDRLLSQPRIDCDLLMAAHHGSLHSRPTQFSNWATPETVVISGGSQRIKDSVVAMYEAEHRCVLRTDRQGAVRYEIDGSRTTVSHWDRDHWKTVKDK